MFIKIMIIILQLIKFSALLISSMTTINKILSILMWPESVRQSSKTFHRTWHQLLGTFGDSATDGNSAEAICWEYIVGKAKDSVIRLLLIY